MDEQHHDEGELLTVAELAAKHGQTQNQATPEDVPYKASHMAADVRHGWAKHKWVTGEDVRLSSEDYLAALEASDAGKVHGPANKRTAEEQAAREKSRAEQNKNTQAKGGK